MAAGGSVEIPVDITINDIKEGNLDTSKVEKTVEQQMQGLSTKISKILGGVDTSKFNKAMTSAMRTAQTSTDKVMKSYVKYIEAITNAGRSTQEYKQAVKDASKSTESLRLNLQGAYSAFNASPTTKGMFKNFEDFLDKAKNNKFIGSMPYTLSQSGRNPFDDLLGTKNTTLRQAVEAYEKSLNPDVTVDPTKYVQFADTSKLYKIVSALREIATSASTADEKIKNFNQSLQDNQYTSSYIEQFKELSNIVNKTNALNEKSDRMNATGFGASPQNLANMKYDADQLQTKLQQVAENLRNLVTSGQAFTLGNGNSIAELARIDEIVNQTSSDLFHISEGASQAGDALQQTGQQGASSSANIANGFKKVMSVIHKLISSAKKLATQLTKTHKSSSGMTDGMQKGFKNAWRIIMRYILGFRSMYFLVRKLRTTFVSALQTMATKVPEVNEDLSDFYTALNQVKGSIGTAFQPLVSYFMPAIVNIFGKISTMFKKLGIFFATLTGQDYIYDFTGDQLDYAASVDNTTSSLNDATDAAEAYKNQLMGFDEINRLEVDDSNDSGSGSSSTPDIDDIQGTYSKLAIEDGDNFFARLLKQAWENSDFTEVGVYIGESLKSALDYAYDELLPKLETFVNNLATDFATLINGITSVQGLADSIGQVAGKIVNIFWEGINTAVTELDWASIGIFVSNAINSFIDEVDFTSIGTTIANTLNGISTAIDTFVNLINWAAVGTHLGDLVEGFSDMWDAVQGAETIVDIFDGLTEAITNFVNSAGVKKFFSKISDFMTTLSTSTIWSDIATDINNLITLITDFSDALFGKGTQGGYDTGTAFSEGVNLMDQNKIQSSKIGSSISNFAEWLTGFINAALDLVDWGSVWEHIGAGLASVDWISIVWGCMQAGLKQMYLTSAQNIGHDIGQAVLNGLAGTKFGQTVMDTFSGFKTALDTWWKVVSGIVGSVWTLFTTGWTTISNFFAQVNTGLDTFKNNFQQLHPFISKILSYIFSGFTTWWNGIVSSVKMHINVMIALVEGWINGIINNFNSLVSAINTAIAWACSSSFVKNQVFDGVVPQINAHINTVSIPRLAQGAVIPPNHEFLAMLGDQSSGTNIEAPLDTIKQAVAEVLGSSFANTVQQAMEKAMRNSSINSKVYLDGKQLSDSVTKYQRKSARAMG